MRTDRNKLESISTNDPSRKGGRVGLHKRYHRMASREDRLATESAVRADDV